MLQVIQVIQAIQVTGVTGNMDAWRDGNTVIR